MLAHAHPFGTISEAAMIDLERFGAQDQGRAPRARVAALCIVSWCPRFEVAFPRASNQTALSRVQRFGSKTGFMRCLRIDESRETRAILDGASENMQVACASVSPS